MTSTFTLNGLERRRGRRRFRSRRALDRIDAALARHGHEDTTDLIRRMRKAYFADVDALQQSGQVKLPEP